MRTVAEIEAAIEKLPPEDLRELLVRLEEYRAVIGASDALFAMYHEEEQKRARRGDIWMADLWLGRQSADRADPERGYRNE